MIVRTSPGKCDCGGGAVEGARQAGVLEGEILVDAGTGTVYYRYIIDIPVYIHGVSECGLLLLSWYKYRLTKKRT